MQYNLQNTKCAERRVFYVDVGNMPQTAMGFVERVKNEIHPKRIQTKQVVVQQLWMRHIIRYHHGRLLLS